MKTALQIIKKLTDNGFIALIVGGFVRDKVLKNEASDIDIATNASILKVQQLFPNCSPGVGTNFHVNIVDGYEVATFRNDIYENGNCVTLSAETFKEDSERRDLTINAMGLNGDKIIDHWNGQNDLEDRLIRFVDVAALRIHEDPLRMLRACRFAAKIEGRLVPSAFFAIKDHAELINEIPAERIQQEIMKAMKTPKPSIFFENLHRTGLLKIIMPEFDDCWYHDGGNYHSEFVHDHLMLCGDFLSANDPILRLAGYLHDIGKVEAYDEFDFSFKKHECFGSDITRDLLTKLKFPVKVIERICSLILLHMRNVQFDTSAKSIRKTMVVFQEHNIEVEEFISLLIADKHANARKKDLTGEEIVTLHYKFETAFDKVEPTFSVKDLKINGKDVIESGIPQGENVGKVLEYYFELVIDEPEHNDRSYLLDCLNRVDEWNELKGK